MCTCFWEVHADLAFKWIWKSKLQMKLKVYYFLTGWTLGIWSKEDIITSGMITTACSVIKSSKKLLSTWFSPALSASNAGVNLTSSGNPFLLGYKLFSTRRKTSRRPCSWKNSLWRLGASGRRGTIITSGLNHPPSSLGLGDLRETLSFCNTGLKRHISI